MGRLLLGPQDLDDIALAISRDGWTFRDGALPAELTRDLAAELERLAAAERLKPAAVGRGERRRIRRDIRSDLIHWLSPERSAAEAEFLAAMEELRAELNARLFLGLFELEAHFALYPEGSFYRRHLDSFRAGKNRILSVVYYLNPGWRREDGGILRLWDEKGEPCGEVLPEAGRLILFLSAAIPHEVMPTRRPRASIACWFRAAPMGGIL
ncbi:MAG TPA: 2OG-Fe(II) oxygenase [Sphingomonadales bacterium]|mgnify:CR=1 FL=1